MCHWCFTHCWTKVERGGRKELLLPQLTPTALPGFANDQPHLHRHAFVIHVMHNGKEKMHSCLVSWGLTFPFNISCYLTGTAALPWLLRCAVHCRGDGQSCLRINTIKNTSDLQSLHLELNPNLPIVQGCSDQRFWFRHVSGDLRNLFTLWREKQEAETISAPGAFPPAELAWSGRDYFDCRHKQ